MLHWPPSRARVTRCSVLCSNRARASSQVPTPVVRSQQSVSSQRSGVLTGSDTSPDAPLSRHLLGLGLLGEGVTDPSVWLIKTHWPERKGCETVEAHAAVRHSGSNPRQLGLTSQRRSPFVDAITDRTQGSAVWARDQPAPRALCSPRLRR
jgi:hypothetical protein